MKLIALPVILAMLFVAPTAPGQISAKTPEIAVKKPMKLKKRHEKSQPDPTEEKPMRNGHFRTSNFED